MSYTGLRGLGGIVTAQTPCAIKDFPYDPNVLMHYTTPDGRSFLIPADLHPGPRQAVGYEGSEWLSVVTSCWSLQPNSSIMVERGISPFASFIAPDGNRYLKYYNGIPEAHTPDRPVGRVWIRKATNLGEVLGDIFGFIARMGCYAGAGPKAGEMCSALTPKPQQQLPGPGSPWPGGPPVNQPPPQQQKSLLSNPLVLLGGVGLLAYLALRK